MTSYEDGQPDQRLADDTPAGLELPDERILDLQAEVEDPAVKDAAFASIVDQFKDDLISHAGAIAGHYRAEDIVQETFLKAFRGLEGLEARSTEALRRWLFVIVRNTALNTNRSDARTPTASGVERIHSQADDPATQVEHRDSLLSLDQLCENHRVALKMLVRGFSYQEIADAQDVSVKAVKSRINRARSAARRILETA